MNLSSTKFVGRLRKRFSGNMFNDMLRDSTYS